jgi:protein-tyrosine phosphatase
MKTKKNKVVLILNDLFPNENRVVPAPYFGKENEFRIVYNMLDETFEIIAKKLIEKHS